MFIIFIFIIKSKKLNKFFEILLFLIINFFVLSLVEFIAGTLIEHILHIVYWDYSDLPLHLGKYVCVIVSLVWMIYAFLLNYVLYPWLKKLALKTPKLVTVILVILFVIDILYSIYEYLLYN